MALFFRPCYPNRGVSFNFAYSSFGFVQRSSELFPAVQHSLGKSIFLPQLVMEQSALDLINFIVAIARLMLSDNLMIVGCRMDRPAIGRVVTRSSGSDEKYNTSI